MKITLKSIFIVVFLLLPILAHARGDVYYVTQNGSGARSGSSLSNAWAGFDFNSSANWSTTDHANRIDPGDTVYFSGTITSRVEPPEGYGGSSGNYVTLDGWEGGTCDPVANDGCTSAAVIDRPSRANGGLTNYCMYMRDNNYITIQDFNMQDSSGGIGAIGPNSMTRKTTHLIIRRNYIHDMSDHGVQITTSGTPYWKGINYVTFGGALGEGNLVYDTVEDSATSYTDSHCVGFNGCDDLIVSYNKIDNSFQDLSDASNALSIHTTDRALIEYNAIGNPSGQACISLKEYGGVDRIIRFNKCTGCGQQGISVGTNQADISDVYIYGNLVYDSAGGVFIKRNYDNIYIFSNVIHNITEEVRTGQGGIPIDISAYGVPGDVYVFNNTIARGDQNGDRSRSGGLTIYGDSAQKVRVKNNIFYYNNSNDTDTQIHVYPGMENNLVSLEHNTYYSDATPYVNYDGVNRDVATLKSSYSLENDSVPGEVADPGFKDPNGADNIYGTVDDDYTLDGTNINNGADLSQCFNITVQGNVYTICYNDALDPDNTDWTTTPPTVGTAKQEDHGSWERGAYVYSDGSENKLSSPDRLKITIGN
jgi:hypothetical protein